MTNQMTNRPRYKQELHPLTGKFFLLIALVVTQLFTLVTYGHAAKPASLKEPVVAIHDTMLPCQTCHTPQGWFPAKFDHARVGYDLKGAHKKARCRNCHQGHGEKKYKTTAGTACMGCHTDPHRRELGVWCEGCHDETQWRVPFSVAAHEKTAFPLIGRHAFLPCQECHVGQRDRAFTMNALTCVDCHKSDYDNTSVLSIGHREANFSTRCETCHSPWSYQPAQFPAHETCFPIARGDHSGIACLDCHNLITMGSLMGDCNMGTAQCISCHEHRCDDMNDEHRGIEGYQCKSQNCYACHPDGND